MPTELEELVEFLHHGNTQIRQIGIVQPTLSYRILSLADIDVLISIAATENLVGYSTAQPALFKRNQLEPVKDLKLLINDYPPIAKDALTILINISDDAEVCESLTADDTVLEALLRRLTDPKEANADLQCMLLANLAKSSHITKLLTLKRDIPENLSTSPFAIDQLLDCFVKGARGSYNKDANYDYLSYLFADLAKHEVGRTYFLAPRNEDGGIVPLTKIIVFTEHKSTIRRRGVANAIKNVCFDVPSHPILLAPEDEGAGIGLLPYILLPLMGSEEYNEDDTDGMLDECQLLPPDKEREREADILAAHLESLLLLTTEWQSRTRLRDVKVYPIVRELHLQVADEGVREGCDRLVQVLMRSEEGETDGPPRIEEIEDDDEDEKIVEVV